MVLAVDIGNSNIVLGCFEDQTIIFTERMSTNRSATSMEYIVLLKAVLELHGMSGCKFEGGIISSVVPSLTETVKQAMTRLIEKPVMVVGPGVKTGLKIITDNPAQVGSDRVTDAVAAISCYEPPIIIIDMGTATTISVIDRNRNFLGGLIIPGIRISLESLSLETSQLPLISAEPPRKIIGTNTIECMKSGIIYGNASSIDGIIDRIEETIGEPCTAVSTGGLSETVVPFCRRDITIDRQLLMKGLMIIYGKNQ